MKLLQGKNLIFVFVLLIFQNFSLRNFQKKSYNKFQNFDDINNYEVLQFNKEKIKNSPQIYIFLLKNNNSLLVSNSTEKTLEDSALCAFGKYENTLNITGFVKIM